MWQRESFLQNQPQLDAKSENEKDKDISGDFHQKFPKIFYSILTVCTIDIVYIIVNII